MAGWMVETAFQYGSAADILCRNQMLDVAEINAALGVEILLKSLLATPVPNSKGAGTVAQTYERPKIKNKNSVGLPGHDLYAIYCEIPDQVKSQLRITQHEEVLKRKRYTFTAARYRYEEGAARSFDDSLLHALALMIPRFVGYFLEEGSEDPWLLYYQTYPEKFTLPTGISLWLG